MEAKQRAAESLLRWAGLSLGAGAFARAVLGLHDYVSEPKIDPLMHTSSVPTPLPITVHTRRKRPQPAQPALPAPAMPKVAMVQPAQPQPAGGLTGALANILPDSLANTPHKPLANTWGIPLATGVTLGGAYGGWKLIDWLLGNRRKREVADDVEAAKQDYDDALTEQYNAAMRAKTAEDALGIDDLFGMEKTAVADALTAPLSAMHNTIMWPWRGVLGNNAVEAGQGAVLAAAGLLGLGTGVATYNWAKGRNRERLLEKAIQLRARQRQFSPTPFYATTERKEV